MAGITFNIILIRVHQDRLRLTRSNASVGGANRDKKPPVLRFRTTDGTTNHMTPESQATHQTNEERLKVGVCFDD